MMMTMAMMLTEVMGVAMTMMMIVMNVFLTVITL